MTVAPWSTGRDPRRDFLLLVLAAAFLGSLIAIVTRFWTPWEALLVATMALAFLGIVVTHLNPWTRQLFFLGAGIAGGALVATAAWRFPLF